MKNINIPVFGSETKSIDFSPWGGIDGFLSATSGGVENVDELRKLVPWLNKAIVMTANAVAQLPIEFERGEEVLDNKRVWGGVSFPQTLLYKVTASLCGGSAYLIPEVTSKAIVDLRYVEQNTITPYFDDVTGGLKWFERQYNGRSEKIAPDNMIYFWLPDDTIEIGPAQITPISNALLPAGLIAAMDASLKVYGERGFIPPMILSAKGMPNKAEAEKAERWWNAFLRGWTKTVAKIINAEAMTPEAIGAGMEDMKGSYIEITRQQIENIAAAFNIPLSLFLSNSANYATSVSDRRVWYESGLFVTLYQTVEDTLNFQLFNKFGIEFHFKPEAIDAFQEEENEKSGSLASLSSTFTQYPEASIIAAEVLGYDLTEEQIAEIRLLSTDTSVQDIPTQDTSTDPQMVMPTPEQNAIAEEIIKWRAFAEKPRKREFDAKFIPAAMAEKIRVGLREAGGDAQKITAVFDDAVKSGAVQNNDSIKELAQTIEKAIHEIESPL